MEQPSSVGQRHFSTDDNEGRPDRGRQNGVDMSLVLCAKACNLLLYRADAVYVANYMLSLHFLNSNPSTGGKSDISTYSNSTYSNSNSSSSSSSSSSISSKSALDSTVVMSVLFLCGKLTETCRTLRDVIMSYKYAEEQYGLRNIHKTHVNNSNSNRNLDIDIVKDIDTSNKGEDYAYHSSSIDSFVFDKSYVKLKKEVAESENHLLRLVGFLGCRDSSLSTGSNSNIATLMTGDNLILQVPHKYFLNIGKMFSLDPEIIHLGLIVLGDACTCSQVLISYRPQEIAISAWFIAFNLLQMAPSSSSAVAAATNDGLKSPLNPWDVHLNKMSISTLASQSAIQVAGSVSGRYIETSSSRICDNKSTTSRSSSSSSSISSSSSSSSNSSSSRRNMNSEYKPQDTVLWKICEKFGTSYELVVQCSDIVTDHMLFLKDLM